jgi:methyl-accepting chemotaxis protein
MKLHSLKLGTKLTAAFVLVCLFSALVSLIGIRNMGILNQEADLMYERDLKSLAAVKEANINLLYVARDRRSALLATSTGEREKFLARADENLAAIRRLIDEARHGFVTEQGKANLAEIDRLWADYVRMGQDLHTRIAASRLDDRQELTRFLFTDFAAVANQIDDRMTALAAQKEELAKAASERATELYASSRNTMLALVAGAMLLGVAIGTWMARSLTRQLGAEPHEATALAQRVAGGDLSATIRLRDGDDASIMAALKAMQDSLARVVQQVRSHSESVASASTQIAQGNQDLSQRTEEQASALQQTAASMEQLGSTVKQNADNAQQANQLALGASSVAQKGGEVVAEVVTTMRAINDSSRRIADIIGVIDGIAFQTNILALNAAVEAARAGEQGRGFAVVAGEVRSLASRSAEAAREIKSLIGTSVERVEQGSALVDRAGETMAEVVASIRRVSDIVAEISAASREQNTGVQQIGEAVGQMDQVTQQNAALVEESAAAAESLKAQAQALVEVVSVFKLGAGHGAATASTAPAGSAAAPAANAPVAERRGPGRATNVTRPRFGKPAAAEPGTAAPQAAARTGTDDWQSF